MFSPKRIFTFALLAAVLPAVTANLLAQDSGWPQAVLLTNDDGIEAEGLLALVRAFAPQAKVYVVAPLVNRSGSTNYVSAVAKRSIDVEQRDLGDGIVAYGVDGYPADAVVWALTGLLAADPPDLVISGVNTGPNLTGDWNLSGTVGAAQIAAFFGVPAVAVSGWTAEHPETLEAVARWMVAFSQTPTVRGLEPGQYLTVSVPRVAASEIEGAVIARRAPRSWSIEFQQASTSAGRERWSLRFVPRQISAPVGSDLYYYERNRIAIVPMRADENDWESLQQLLESSAGLPAWPPGASH